MDLGTWSSSLFNVIISIVRYQDDFLLYCGMREFNNFFISILHKLMILPN